MLHKITSITTKAPVLLIFLAIFATACHTPEDMKEIGPQKPLTEEPKFLAPPAPLQDKSSATSSKNSGLILNSDSESTVEIYGNGTVLIKTPFKPSLRIPKPKCKTC